MYLKNEMLRGLDDPEFEYEDWQINELKKCIKDPVYFILKYVKVIDVDKGVIDFQPRPYSIKFIKNMHKHTRLLSKFPRQSGKSITVAAYLAWYVIFNKNKNAIILAHQKSMATEQLSRIKNIIMNVPLWLQQPVIKWNEGSIWFANGTRVTCSATQGNSARGGTVSFLYLDEFAFVEPHIANEFMASVLPTVSSSKTAKIVVTSTPNSLNHFWKMWTDAEHKANNTKVLDDKDWRIQEIAWNEVPGRDEAWRAKEESMIGSVRFAQEYECSFQGSVATLVDTKFFANEKCPSPIKLLDKNRLRVYEYPLSKEELLENDWNYLITIDPAMGTKQDYSVCQVWLVRSNIDITQVAVYESNDVIPKEFINKAHSLAKIYHNAGIIVETMEQAGGVIVNGLHYDKNYTELIHMNDKGLGFNMSHNKKIEACVFMQVYIEKKLLKIVDQLTIEQLCNFGKKGNSYKALGDGHDDLVTPILSMLYYVNSPYFNGKIDDEKIYAKKTTKNNFDDLIDENDDNMKGILERLSGESDEESAPPMMFGGRRYTGYSPRQDYGDYEHYEEYRF